MNKRALLAGLCERSGATGLMLAWKRRTAPSLLSVLTFHRVADVGPEYMFDDGVVETSPDELARQLAQIREHFTPVTMADVRSFVDGGHALPHNPVLVTFDDGYLDNFAVALPLLQRFGIAATFFIATDYITHRRVFWWDRVAYTIKASPRAALSLAYPTELALDLSSEKAKLAAIRAVLRVIKRTFGLELDSFLDQLAAAAGVVWNAALERRFADHLLMTWDHVRALRAGGMDVQSHTRTHRVLQTLPAEALAGEIAGSRAELERELDHPVYAISYPVGHTINDRSELRDALVAAGYRLGFTNATGAQSIRGKTIDRFNLSRMALDSHTPDSLFKAMLALPRVFD